MINEKAFAWFVLDYKNNFSLYYQAVEFYIEEYFLTTTFQAPPSLSLKRFISSG